MLGNIGDISKMLEQVQEQAQKMEQELASKEYHAKVAGGMLDIKMNGKREVIDLNIDDSLLEDKESLQILLISCINDINKMVDDDKKSSGIDMLGGMGSMFGKE